jgi:hypothetical protein
VRILIIFFLLLTARAVTATPLEQWAWRNPQPFSSGYNSVAHGGGGWVAAASQTGLLSTSPDGTNWDISCINTQATFSACVYGNGRFVLGNSRGLWISTNAHNWFKAPGTQTFQYLTFGNNWFVGSDGNGKVWRSTDATNWSSGSIFGYPENCFCFANGKFFNLGGGSFSESLYISTDGANWGGGLNVGTNWFSKVVYGNGRYVSLNFSNVFNGAPFSEFRVSTNGTNWGAITRFTNTLVGDLIFADGRFLGIDLFGGVFRSVDGTNWSEDMYPVLGTGSRIDWDGQLYVVLGGTGAIVTSPDTTNWTLRAKGPRDTLMGLANANGTMLGVGGNAIETLSQASTIVVSKDGRTWTRQEPGTTNWLASAAYGGGRYVAVGTNGTIVSSVDATNWTATPSPRLTHLTSVAYGSNIFVAVGGTGAYNGVILSSADGVTWLDRTPVTFAVDPLYCVTWAQGKFVAVGQTNVLKQANIVTSFTGTDWSLITSSLTNGLRTVSYGSGVFVAAGDRGQIGVSSDAIHWTDVSFNSTSWRALAYGGGQFMLAQQSILNFATSTNGTNWSLNTSLRNYSVSSIYALAAGTNSFFLGGMYGAVMESQPFVSPPTQISLELKAGNPAVLAITAPEFHGYEIQDSGALTGAWTVSATISNFSATTFLKAPTNGSARFYRVRSLN